MGSPYSFLECEEICGIINQRKMIRFTYSKSYFKTHTGNLNLESN